MSRRKIMLAAFGIKLPGCFERLFPVANERIGIANPPPGNFAAWLAQDFFIFVDGFSCSPGLFQCPAAAGHGDDEARINDEKFLTFFDNLSIVSCQKID